MAKIKSYGLHSKIKAKEHVIEFSMEFDEEVTSREAEDLVYELLTVGHQYLDRYRSNFEDGY